MIRQWNGDARGDSGAAAVFEAWFLRLAPTIAGDDLGPILTEGYQGRFTYVTRFIINTLTSDDAGWCDARDCAAHRLGQECSLSDWRAPLAGG